MPPTDKKIVHKIEEGVDPQDILCTTYQMRNPFRQFADGVITELDVHCYFQHCFAADLCPTDGRVLDVCCGRGLLIPFLHYRRSPGLYVGVDICDKNAVWKNDKDPRRTAQIKSDWRFPRLFVESNVATMVKPVQQVAPKPFDLIVYTSAIEHMQPEDQKASLQSAAELSSNLTIMYLTCPATPSDKNQYDTQYKAHVYEPHLEELEGWLKEAGWNIKDTYGLCTKTKHFRQILEGEDLEQAERIYSIMPRQQALPTIGTLFPQTALEVAYILNRKKKTNGFF